MKKIIFFLTFIVFVFNTNAQKPFITVWKTDNSGTTNSSQIKFPTAVNLSIKWELSKQPSVAGSANIDIVNNVITFPQPGIYILSATTVDEKPMKFNNGFLSDKEDAEKLLEVKQWGSTKWESMYCAFIKCKNMNITATDIPDLSIVKSISYMFSGCENLVGNPRINNWDVSNVEEMQLVFDECRKFNQPIGNWNTSNVTNMGSMFNKAESFNQPIGNWNTSKVKIMASMFAEASSFNQPIGNWNTNNVTDMGSMFYLAKNFNQPVGNWNTGSVKYMNGMFYDAHRFNKPLDKWNFDNVKDMSYMFKNAASFNQKVSDWKTLSFTDKKDMFFNATYFNDGKPNNFKPNVPEANPIAAQPKPITNPRPFISVWKTDNEGMTKNNEIRFNAHLGGIEFLIKWEEKDNPSVNGEVKYNYRDSIITFPKPGIYILKAYFPLDEMVRVGYENNFVDYRVGYGFIHPRDNNKLLLITQWGDAIWRDLAYAFYGCKNLDITARDIPNIKDCENFRLIFKDCSSLVYNESINRWNVSTVKDFREAFAGCTKFNQPLNLWNTSNALSMIGTFKECSIFNQNLNKWDVSNVNTAAYMFKDCSNFNQPLDKWKVKNMEYITEMFSGAKSFKQDLSKWQFLKLNESKNVFAGATAYTSVRFKEVSAYEEEMIVYERNKLAREAEQEREYAKQRQENNAKAKEGLNTCNTYINGGIRNAIEKFNTWKSKCDLEFNYQIKQGNIGFHTTELILSLRRLESDINLAVCNGLGNERQKLLDLTRKKIADFETFQKEYDKANKKPSIWEILVGGLQIATGTYE